MNAHVINITPPTDAERAALAKLSPRQREVMIGLALGRTCRELADELSISVKTVDTHRGAVLKRLRLRGNVDVARFAIRAGEVTL
jgi:DNA-binding NarL/FixJ family response regulator